MFFSLPLFRPFLAVVGVFFWVWLFVLYLHTPRYYALPLAINTVILLGYALLCYWCDVRDLSEQAQQKRHYRRWLFVLVGCSFLTTFALIPLHHWLQGHGQHEMAGHGPGGGPTEMADHMLSRTDAVSVFTTVDVNSEGLPVRVVMSPPQHQVLPGEILVSELTIYNPLPAEASYRLQTAWYPAEAATVVSDAGFQEWVTVPAQSQLTLYRRIALSEAIPENLANFTTTTFVYGQSAPARPGYQKMLSRWP